MDGNGKLPDASTDGAVLRWPGRVVTAERLRQALDGHREIALPAKAVLTPLADEYLRSNGVHVRRQPAGESADRPPAQTVQWGYAQQRRQPLVASAVQALRREGVDLEELTAAGDGPPCRWAQALAECVAGGRCSGGVVFCADPGLFCCVANKVAGLRAAAVLTVSQAARATLSLGANLLAVEMPGRTFFEVRQILRTLCGGQAPACPPGVACTLAELDGHAHR
jgi:ribose 5-phosphate isomerase RpiB